ncbi:hypothetical protein BDA99DRAFT_483341 [Phascolomyces articulosus]|uniref:ATP-dependent DNA helicase n=1 Tax=Phascolomyces articulosus TaxID=60185 RepID=A0AAD5KBY7_9FUNG|nr:hypothetical protein BDA99DRAFT_483341 [Phascolomyces articulosus]
MEDSFDFDFDDDELLLAAVEQVEKQQQRVENKNDQTVDDFDDFDDEDLILAAETVEQQVNNVDNGKNRQGQLASFFTSRSASSMTNTPRSVKPLPAESSIATLPRPTINNELLTSTRLEDESPPLAPAPPPLTMQCSHIFDADALPTYLYPVNYPIRLYQWNIVKKSLFNNTLVALPTGLGKTFIAAVVMYNYWRWFPQSKIVFMAPTRPLVTQQIEACFNICGIPQSDTVELTGQTQQERRKNLWTSKRVFFLTPQVLQNDLRSRICPAEKIVCLVVDEAHKAQGNYAYTEVVKLIAQRQTEFRVLALTATPGTNIANVQAVVKNLRVFNIQIRTEDSMDIQQHSHGKNIQTVIVPLEYTAGATGVVPDIARKFRTIFFVPVLNRLNRFQAVYSTDVERNTPYQLLMAQKQFSAHARNFNNAVRNMVFTDFSISHSLSRAYEMLCNHGVGPFLSTIEGTLQEYQDIMDSNKRLPVEKTKLLNNFELKRMIEDLKQQQLQQGFMGHPKLQRLVNILLEHLSQEPVLSGGGVTPSSTTRIIVFSSFRSSVDEIVKCLSEHEPMVRCSHFVGQAGSKDGKKGLNQREQQEIITRFKRGDLNVLVSTSIGEEGLDIGEVDLIVCYDSQSSPLRLLQRMGRTGRKRKGKCVMLMTETEERKYRQAKESYNAVQQAIARGGNLEYFKPNPSVLPRNYQPVWRKKRFSISTYIPLASNSGRSARGRSKTQKVVNPDGTLADDVETEFLQKLGAATMEEAFTSYWPEQDTLKRSQRYLPMNTKPLIHHRVGHSRRTTQFIELYNKIDQRILHGVGVDDEQKQQQQQQPLVGNTLYLPRKRNNGGIMVEAHTMHHIGLARKTGRAMIAEDTDDDGDVVMLMDEKKSVSPYLQQSNTLTTLAATSNNALKSPSISRRMTNMLALNRQRSDFTIMDKKATENDVPLQRTSSDASIHDGNSPRKPQHQSKDSNANHVEHSNTDNIVQGDSWMEEYDSILLLENRLDRSGSYEQPTNDNSNISNGRMVLDTFEDILPPDFKRPPFHNELGASHSTLMRNNTNIDDIQLSPFPFKKLSKEEADQPTLSACMLNWLTRKPTLTESAKKKLQERTRSLKLDAAKEWIYTIFDLPPSPLASTPSFDDDIDIEMLEEWERNLQQQPQQETLQKEHLSSLFTKQQQDGMEQTIQREHNFDDRSQNILVSVNTDIKSIINLDSDSMRYPESPKHKADLQPQQQQVAVTDNKPDNHDGSLLMMDDTTFYEELENKVHDGGESENNANEHSSPRLGKEGFKSINSSLLSPVVQARKRKHRLINEGDSEEQLPLSLSSSPIMRQTIHGHRRQRQRQRHKTTETRHNPFIAMEAEKSSDEELMGSGHGNETDECESTSINANDSFINDEEDTYSQHPPPEEIYQTGLMGDNNRRKTWLDKFQADKWIQAGEQEEEEYTVGNEDETSTSVIQEEITDDIYEYSDDFV